MYGSRMRLFLATFAAFLALSCSSAAQQYRDASMLCVAENDTRESIDACRAKARERFGVTGPVPSATRAADASAPGGAR